MPPISLKDLVDDPSLLATPTQPRTCCICNDMVSMFSGWNRTPTGVMCGECYYRVLVDKGASYKEQPKEAVPNAVDRQAAFDVWD